MANKGTEATQIIGRSFRAQFKKILSGLYLKVIIENPIYPVNKKLSKTSVENRPPQATMSHVFLPYE
jgi:hypothetical protein